MWEAIRANRHRSVLLIFALAAVLILLGYLIGASVHPRGGVIGVVVALFIWIILTTTAALSGRRILLGSVGARQIQHDDYPMLFNVVEEMSIAAGLPKVPDVYLMDCDAPNAFAVGKPEKAAVAVTTGLLMRLSRDELQGVVAHEVGHIVNQDTRFMTLAGVTVAAVVLLADTFLRSMVYSRGRRRRRGKGGGAIVLVALLFAVLAPILAQLLYFACSRRREYLADACSARFTRYPEGLASALQKISGASGKMQKVNRAVAPMFTVNPLKGGAAHSILSTHPPTGERVRVLRSMAGGAAYADYEAAYQQVQGQSVLGRRTVAESQPVDVRGPSEEPEKGDLEKAREVVDILHRLNGMLFLSCVCGLRTKVPEGFEQDEIRCPRCGRVVPLPVAAAAAAGAALGSEIAEEEDASPPKTGKREPLTVEYTPGRWQSVRCACGRTVQLSPSLSADRVTCRSCGRTIRLKRQ
ncbi:MAG: M48 family metallopeptidase [Candidatus Brocadiia bacterium]